MAHRRERTIILAALFVALSVALGFLLAGIPNLELMTLAVFMAGSFCGARLGIAVGALSMLLFSLLNPLGPAPAPLLAAQIAGFALIGAGGGLVGPRLAPAGPAAAAAAAAAGFALTIAYDFLTTAATALVALGARRFVDGLGGIALAGAVFVAWHVGVNTAVFAVAVPPLMRSVRAWQGGKPA
jgi:hypothetical protein